jgi:MOSC domain-containing protein YiiM
MSEESSHPPSIGEMRAVSAQSGRVEWIGLSTGRRAGIQSSAEVLLEDGTGLAGDHHATSGKSKRQVTLIQKEHLSVVASLLGHADTISPELARRNLVVSGISVLSLKDHRFKIGGALLEGTGHCHPCSRMEETLGVGGYNAMRGHGGITARVIAGDVIRLGDPVELLAEPTAQE